jgi:hypothetical protein
MLIFFIILLKLGPRVDLRHVSSHVLGGITGVTGVNQSFYCVGSKNDIILIKKKVMEIKSQWVLT